MSRIVLTEQSLRKMVRSVLEEAAGQNIMSIIDEYIKNTEYDIRGSWGNCAFYAKDFVEKMGGRMVYMPLANPPGKDPEDHIAPVLGRTIIDFAYVPGKGVSKHDRTASPPRFNPGWEDGSWPLLTKLSDGAFEKSGRYGKLGYLKGGKYAPWEYEEFPQLKEGKYPLVMSSLPGFATVDLPSLKKALKESNNPFERIAFADQRKELPPGTEPNTPLEDKAFRELYYFVEANEDLSPDSLAAIKDSLKRGLHSDIIYYSQAPAHYRGMHLTAEEIDKHFNIDPEDLPASGKRVFKFPFEFKPRKASGLSSWTSDYDIAEELPMDYAESDEWIVVLVAPAASNPDNFLDLADMYKALDTWYHYQKECIALGPVMVSEIHVYRPEDWA